MNSKQRFLQALHRQPVDRPPVAAVTTGITLDMMERAGIYWPEAHHDPALLAGLAESVWLYAGLECIKLPFGMTVEVEALGAPIDFRTRDTLPTEKHSIFNHPDELSVPDDFFDRGRVPTVLEAISRLRRRYDSEVAVVSSIVGPFSLGAKLFGFDNFLIWLITEPDFVHAIMRQLTPLAIRYANAQVEAGADAITLGEATCSGDLISPNTYRDFIAPYHRQLCSAIHAPTILHICGKSTRHAPHIAETGATAYSFDEGIDVAQAKPHLDAGGVSLVGYVPTVAVLLNGGPQDAYESARQCLDAGVHVLTPGCSVPPHTPIENLTAMLRAADDWASERKMAVSD